MYVAYRNNSDEYPIVVFVLDDDGLSIIKFSEDAVYKSWLKDPAYTLYRMEPIGLVDMIDLIQAPGMVRLA